jgi:DNA-binding LacI/PurR family transcriptional regulator
MRLKAVGFDPFCSLRYGLRKPLAGRTGKMSQGTRERRPTLADVAKRAGVSRSLASLAIRGEGYVRAESRERIARAAAELNYRPNMAARLLASAEAGYIGIVIGQVTNPLQAEIARWASVFAAEKGLTGLVSLDAETDDKAEAALDALLAHRVSGVVLVGTPYEKPAIARIAARIPSVYIGRLLRAVDVDSVTTDHIRGAGLVVSHLASLGHRHIVHVSGGHSPGSERLSTGYTDAMREHGLQSYIRIIDGAFTIDAGAAAGRELFEAKVLPDAIFAASDLTAIGLLNEGAKRDIAIPGQVALVGYDDVMLAGTETLSLSTVRQPSRDLALAGVDALIRRLKAPQSPTGKVLVPPTLVVRRSSKRQP